MRARRSLIALLGAALLTGAVVFEGGPDPVIFPKQSLPLFFPHDLHVRPNDPARGISGEGMSCDFCHENVGESKSAGDRDIPGHDTCEGCHAEWIGDEDTPAPRADCARCHRDLASDTASTAAPLVIPPPNIVFSHAEHVEHDVKCVDCHDRVPKKTVATRDDFPTMDRCIACHEERGAPTTCKTCHLTGKTGRLVTEFPQGKLQPRRLHLFAVHDGEFLRDHAVPAQRDRDYCDTCHQEDFCLSCHDGLGRDVRYHPGDWISSHPVSAKKDELRCQSCHRVQTFCLGCHVRSGVATLVELGNPFQTTRRTVRTNNGVPTGPHPMAADGWLTPTSRNFHGFHAQRNIRTCASCHQEQYCVRCHGSAFGVGASVGGNPHGPNPQRLKGSAAAKENARMCLKCHHPLDDKWR
jgi:hypothetical protein